MDDTAAERSPGGGHRVAWRDCVVFRRLRRPARARRASGSRSARPRQRLLSAPV